MSRRPTKLGNGQGQEAWLAYVAGDSDDSKAKKLFFLLFPMSRARLTLSLNVSPFFCGLLVSIFYHNTGELRSAVLGRNLASEGPERMRRSLARAMPAEIEVLLVALKLSAAQG